MHQRALTLLLIPALLVPVGPASAADASPLGWTNRLVITYATSLRGDLPAGVQAVRADGRRVVVDLGRRATRADLLRFRDPSIIAIEPDRRMQVATTPDDPSFTSQWDMSDAGAGAADYSVRAPAAWEITTGSSELVIAVLDTGITSHSEFSGRTVAGYDFISDSLIANDGNERDSNPSDPGDWITSGEASGGYFYGCAVDDSSWHGTHVAGTIGATGDNASGIAGLNWTSKIQPIRVLGKCGGYDSDIADAIRWAAGGTVSGVPANATPARIISLSLGGYGSCSSGMQSAINDARSRGALVVIAAGNENSNASSFSPGNCPGVITVAATGRNGKRAYYSNYGSTVEIAAPGGNMASDSGIYSTMNSGSQGPSTQSYTSYQGTSMAAPHVAGVLSLLLSVDPLLDESAVLALLASTSTPFAADVNANSCSTAGTCGPGIINAAALIAAAAPVQAAQTIDFPVQADRAFNAGAFDPGATASSGLPVTYSVSGNSVSGRATCTTNGILVTPKNGGICVITANQTGSVSYLPAASVSRSVTVTQSIMPSASVDPILSAAPVIGTPVTLTAGTWGGVPVPVVGSQWFQCSKSSRATTSTRVPSGCTAILDATEDTYTPVVADGGKYLRVGETATNSAGTATRYSATSQRVAPLAAPPFNLVAPSVPASLRARSYATASQGTFGGSEPIAYTYSWYACLGAVSSSPTLVGGCTIIGGATALRYRVSSDLLGKFLLLRVTAVNAYGNVTIYSASSGAVR